jgi:hypothetical protein
MAVMRSSTLRPAVTATLEFYPPAVNDLKAFMIPYQKKSIVVLGVA